MPVLAVAGSVSTIVDVFPSSIMENILFLRLAKSLCCGFAVLSFSWAWPAHASAQQNGTYTFAQVRALIEASHYDEARNLVATSGDGTETNQVAQAFTDALILKHQGKLQESAERMQQIITAYPQFDRVRQELAHTYFLMGDGEHAKYQFELLAASSQSPAFRSLYNNYIDAIDANRPWTLNGYIALAPSTNITKGVSEDTIFIAGIPFTPKNRKQSGVGLNYGVSGTYQFKLDERFALAFGGSLDGIKYRDQAFDELSGQVFSELSYKIDDWRFGIGPTLERTVFAWKGYVWGYGVQGYAQKRVGDGGDTIRMTARTRYLDYDVQDYYSGLETTIGLRYQHVFSASLLASIGATATWMNAQDFNAYKSIRPNIEVYSDLPFGILGSLGVGYEFRNYEGTFPMTGSGREDRQFTASVGLTLRKLSFKNIAPRLEYGYRLNSSNVDLYDYDSHNFGFYLTKKY